MVATTKITVPTLFLGAVVEHRLDTPPDTVGGLGVMNVDPVGVWSVSFPGMDGGAGLDSLEDLILDLRVVITPEA